MYFKLYPYKCSIVPWEINSLRDIEMNGNALGPFQLPRKSVMSQKKKKKLGKKKGKKAHYNNALSINTVIK